MNIVDYHIEMLDVGAADAFIINLMEQQGDIQKNHLILVDAGEYSDGDKVLKHIRRYYKNKKINLAIVTHCDTDHYGGFVRMLEKIQDDDADSIPISKFWINDPTKHGIKAGDVKSVQTQRTVNERLKSVYTLNNGLNLLDLIKSLRIPFQECFSGFDINKRNFYPKKDNEYDCITIVGPSESYYESEILDMRNNLHAIVEASEGLTSFSNESANYIDDASDDGSSHNQTSIIFSLELAGKKYLFTGDAGEKAFKNVFSTHRPLMKNVYWLKVPHHGSDHNLSSELIAEMNPYVAYISTEREEHYLSQTTVDALKAVGCRVYSTHVHGNMLHHGNRQGYTTAEPL